MIIDCDIHNMLPGGAKALIDYTEEPYRTELAQYGFRQLNSGIRYEDGGTRWDSVGPNGEAGGIDPNYTARALLDKYGITYGLLTNYTGPIAGMPDPDYQAAVCRAMNDYTIDHWLPADDRYVLGLQTPTTDPQLGAREIERLAGHPRVRAACIAASAHRIPLGNRYYWPIYEAAERHDLAIHLHPSTTSVIASASTLPSGMATNYLQSHVAHPLFYMGDMISLIFEGVFERFPRLRVAFVEGGVSWLPHLMWRMDKEFKALRQQAPFLKRLPSEYVRSNIRMVTQPIEEPKKIEHLVQIFNMIDADTTVMWSSDYPHFDFDEPSVLPKQLGESTIRRILYDNAAECFGLPARRAADVAVVAEAGRA